MQHKSYTAWLTLEQIKIEFLLIHSLNSLTQDDSFTRALIHSLERVEFLNFVKCKLILLSKDIIMNNW